jgi:membrane protein
LRHQVNALRWVLFGWVGTLLVGSQVMKLIMEGIRLIYGDQERHSFIGRQFRGMLLFYVTIVGWMMAVALSVFSHPLRQWMTLGFSQSAVVRGFWNIMLPIMGLILTMLVLALIYRFARPSATTWVSVLPGASAATILWWGLDIWSLRPKDAVWIGLPFGAFTSMPTYWPFITHTTSGLPAAPNRTNHFLPLCSPAKATELLR